MVTPNAPVRANLPTGPPTEEQGIHDPIHRHDIRPVVVEADAWEVTIVDHPRERVRDDIVGDDHSGRMLPNLWGAPRRDTDMTRQGQTLSPS